MTTRLIKIKSANHFSWYKNMIGCIMLAEELGENFFTISFGNQRRKIFLGHVTILPSEINETARRADDQ